MHYCTGSLELHLIIISCSNVWSFRRQRSGLKIFPAILKIRSTGADDAGIVRYLQAIVDKIGILVLPVLQWVTVHGKTWLS